MGNKPTAPASAARVALADAKLHGDEAIETPIGPIELTHNYFDDDTSKRSSTRRSSFPTSNVSTDRSVAMQAFPSAFPAAGYLEK
jgi:hypothetical protein